MKKKIKNINFEIHCYDIDTDKITEVETISTEIVNFIADKIREIDPNFTPEVRINETYRYEKEEDKNESW